MYTQVCACICCVVMYIDQGDSVASLPCFSRSRCLCCAWWRWTSITSSSQTCLPGDVTTVVPPFNHPISQPYTPPTSLDEARQSYHLIGYFIRHLQRLKQSCVLTRESVVSSVQMSATALIVLRRSRAYACMRQATLNARIHLGLNLIQSAHNKLQTHTF